MDEELKVAVKRRNGMGNWLPEDIAAAGVSNRTTILL